MTATERKRIAIFLVFMAMQAAVTSSQVSEQELLAKCRRKTEPKRYPHCMEGGDVDIVLWCDQSNYTKIQAPHELGHISKETAKTKEILFINDSCLLGIQREHLKDYKLLTKILASDNFITRLYKSAFSHNKKLTELDLSKNLISVIEDDSFKDLSELFRLDLSDNQIMEVRPGQFRHLSSLQEISLARNRITVLSYRARARPFRHMRNLRILDLSENNIVKIGHGLVGLANLENLFLDGNSLSGKLTHEAFQGLGSLKTLSVSHNEIDEWPESSEQLFRHLLVLNLSSNMIEKFERSRLANLTELRHLSLGGNSLRTIDGNLFSSNVKLKFINLSANYIKEIPGNAFESLRELQTLLLEGNRLEILHKEWFLHLSKQQIPRVNMQGDNWDCDCETAEFKTFLGFVVKLHKSQDEWNQSLGNQLEIRCSKPKSRENEFLRDLDHEFCIDPAPTKPPTKSTTTTPTTKSTTVQTTSKTTSTQTTPTEAGTNTETPQPTKYSPSTPDIGSFHTAIIASLCAVIIITIAIMVLCFKLKTSPWTKARRRSKRKRNESSQPCVESGLAITEVTTSTGSAPAVTIANDDVFTRRASIDGSRPPPLPEPNHPPLEYTRPQTTRNSRSDENTYITVALAQTGRQAQQHPQLQQPFRPSHVQHLDQYYTPTTSPKQPHSGTGNSPSITVPKQLYSKTCDSMVTTALWDGTIEENGKARVPRRPSVESFQSCKDLPSFPLYSKRDSGQLDSGQLEFHSPLNSINVSMGYRESGDGAEQHTTF